MALSGGYIRELYVVRGATIGVGGLGTVNVVPSSLKSAYGSSTPVGGMVFLRLRAVGMGKERAGGMNKMSMPG
jgi:hypothetical protein